MNRARSARRRIEILLLSAMLGIGCSPAGAPDSWAPRTLAELGLRGRIAQLLVADAGRVPQEQALRWIREDSVGGVLAGEDTAGERAERIERMRGAAPIPLWIAADLGGVRGSLPAEAAERAGATLGAEARSAGIHLALLTAPARVAPGGFAELVKGIRGAGVRVGVELAGEGYGETRVFHGDRAMLEATLFPALRTVLRAEPDAMALPPVAVPAITGDTLPLPVSAAAVRGLLRRDLGFGGLVVARASGSPEQVVRAVAAGADLVIGVTDPGAAVDAVAAAVRDGRIPRRRIDQAAERVLEAKARSGVLRAQIPDALATARPAAGLRADTLVLGDPREVGMDPAGLARADRAIREGIREGVFPGAALAVGRRGGLVRLRGYGTLSGEPGSPAVDAGSTLYDLASLSKTVGTTAAIMALVDEDKLRLDAPARRYLPEFRGGSKDRVTLRHLLTHTSGLPSGDWLYGSADSPGEAFHQVLRAPLRRAPGERVEYSDFGMILLAEIAERAAGVPLDRFLAKRVYAPLGMTSTMYLPPRTLRPEIAPSALPAERRYTLVGEVHDANAFRLGGVAGHAGLFSVAADLAVFAQTLLNGGAYGSARVFSPEVVRTFRTRQPGAEERALGWDTPSERSSAGSYFSARSFGHTGFTGTSLWIDPERELFVVLLTNRTLGEGSAREILEMRREVHDAVARAVTDTPVRKRAGAK